MRTQMHQDAFPGEDISDRPLPEASVPGILALVDERPTERSLPGGETWRREHDVTLDSFVLPPELEATQPPEVTLGRRDAVRMLVSIGEQPPRPSVARDLADVAATRVTSSSSTRRRRSRRRSTPRRPTGGPSSSTCPPSCRPGCTSSRSAGRSADGTTAPDPDDFAGDDAATSPAAGTVRVLGRMPRSVRLWVATLELPVPLLEHLDRWGRPIRYRYVPDSWPLDAYTNAFAREPGSAEMPSAGRVLTPEVVTDLVAHGVVVAPIVLHTGVASLEAHETPYPERYRVPAATARLVNATRADRWPRRRRRHDRRAGAGDGRRRRRRRAPRRRAGPSSSSRPSAACASSTGCSPGGTSRRPATCGCSRRSPVGGRWNLPTRAALDAGYRWHEFGDVHLILPASDEPARP